MSKVQTKTKTDAYSAAEKNLLDAVDATGSEPLREAIALRL